MSLKIKTASCDKHGDIEESVFVITVVEQGIIKHKAYCLHCIMELIDVLYKSVGIPQSKVTMEEVKDEV